MQQLVRDDSRSSIESICGTSNLKFLDLHVYTINPFFQNIGAVLVRFFVSLGTPARRHPKRGAIAQTAGLGPHTSAARRPKTRASRAPHCSASAYRLDVVGGSFSNSSSAIAQQQPFAVRGSMDSEYFLEMFEVTHRNVEAGARVIDQRAAKFDNPFNDAERKRVENGASGECSA